MNTNDAYKIRVDNLVMEDAGYECADGPMFSGKTKWLIGQTEDMERYAGFKSIVIRPDADFLHKSALASHDGVRLTIKQEFISTTNPKEVLALTDKYECFSFDEAQFYTSPEIVDTLQMLAFSGKRVMVDVLTFDYRGLPFNLSSLIIASAVKRIKFVAICTVCGAQATMTQRLDELDKPVTYEDDLTVVGDEKQREDKKSSKVRRYTARCRRHHVLLSPTGERVIAMREGVYVPFSGYFSE
ncbi:MAG: hypothetical protein ABIA11_00750 [Patescibacteria group bacterium]|nr:hypothetical protein [Patescibacteria group bacterium]